jgi:hypothetical protein
MRSGKATLFFIGILFVASVAFATQLNVLLVFPANNTNASATTVNFVFTPINQNSTLGEGLENFSGATVWITNTTALPVGVSGLVWGVANNTNASDLQNATQATITAGLYQGRYSWNINVSTNATSNFSQANYTFTIDNTAPGYFASILPLNGSNQSSTAVDISFVPGDGFTGVANTTVWATSTGPQTASFSNTTWILNGTPVTGGLVGLAAGRYNLTYQLCDFANNCANFTGVFFTIDNVNPGYFVSVSPTNNTNQSSPFVNVSFVPGDAFTGVTNTTVWARSAGFGAHFTNTSVTNGTQVTGGFAGLTNDAYNLTYQLCDWANSCANFTGVFVIVDNTNPTYLPISPTNNSNQSANSINVSFVPFDGLAGVANTTVWLRNTTGFDRHFTNTSIANATLVSGGFLPLSESVYNFTYQLCDWPGNCANYTGVFTTIDFTNPGYFVPVTPANNTNQSSAFVNVSFVPGDALTGVANTTVWANSSVTGITRHFTNTTVTNGTLVTGGFAGLGAATYNFTYQLCDWANNCANYTDTVVTVLGDVSPPGYFVSVKPSGYQASTFVNVSFVPGDAFTGVTNTTVWLGFVANATIFRNFDNTSVVNGTLVNGGFVGVGTGNYSLTYQLCDTTGNCANFTGGSNVTVDTSAPNYIVVDAPVNNSNQSATGIGFYFTTGDAFTGVDNVTAWLFNATDTVYISTSLASGGNLNNTPYASSFPSVGAGPYNITFRSCDFANNCANLSTSFVTVDPQPPGYFVSISPTNNSNQYVGFVNVSFVPGDALTGAANTTVWLRNSTGAFTSSFTNSTVTNGTQVTGGFAGLTNGAYNLTYQLCDLANTCANFTGVFFTVDTQAPGYFVSVKPSGYQASTFVNVSFVPGDALTGVANTTVWLGFVANATIFRSFTNTSVVNGTLLTGGFAAVGTGNYSLTYQLCDAVGNCANITGGSNVTVDTDAPNYVVVSAPVNNSNQSNITINFNYVAGDAFTGIDNLSNYLRNESGVIAFSGASSSGGNANNTPTIGYFENLAAGRYNLTFGACDFAGNCANLTTSFVTVDPQPPNYFVSVLPGQNHRNQTASFINVTFVPGDALSMMANTTVWLGLTNGTLLGHYTNASVENGTTVVGGFVGLPEGNYLVTHQLCDLANNCANYSTAVTIDNSGPAGLWSNLTGQGAQLQMMLGQNGATFTQFVGLRRAKPVVNNATFMVALTDAGSGVQTVTVSNGTPARTGFAGLTVAAVLHSRTASGSVWNATLNVSNFSEGFQNFTLTATDFASNSQSMNLSGNGAGGLFETNYDFMAEAGVPGLGAFYVDNYPTVQGIVFSTLTSSALNGSNIATDGYAVNITVQENAFGQPPSYAQSFTVNSQGEFFIDVIDERARANANSFGQGGQPPTLYNYIVRVKGLNNQVSFASPNLPPMPIGVPGMGIPGMPVSGRNLYVVPAETLNIAASNGTHCTSFYGMILDQRSGIPYAFFDNRSAYTPTPCQFVEAIVPANRNFTITLGNEAQGGGYSFPARTVAVTTENISTTNAQLGQYNGSNLTVTINTSFIIIESAGNWSVNNGTLSSPAASNLSNVQVNYTRFQIQMVAGPSGFIPPAVPMLKLNAVETNASGGWNTSLPSGSPYLASVFGHSGPTDSTGNYFMGFVVVPGPTFNDNLATAVNQSITLYRMAGVFRGTSASDPFGFNTSKTRIQFVDDNGTLITQNQQGQQANDINVEVETNYSGVQMRRQYRTQGQASVDVPLLAGEPVKIKVFAGGFMPIQRLFSGTLVTANDTLNVTLQKPSMRPPRNGGQENSSFISGVQIEFVTYNSTCNRPSPPNSCYLSNINSNFRVEGGSAQQFDSQNFVMGGTQNILIKDNNTNTSVLIIGLSMDQSSIPNMEFDTNPIQQSQNGSAQVRRFGSLVPSNSIESAWLATPYNASAINESLNFSIDIPYLYDDDGNLAWNVSANTSSQVPSQYQDYSAYYPGIATNASYLKGIQCFALNDTNIANTSRKCLVDTTLNLIWLQVPHFSTIGAQGAGQPVTTASSSSSSSSSSSNNGGTYGGYVGSSTPTPEAPAATPTPATQATPEPTTVEPDVTPTPAAGTGIDAGKAIMQANSLFRQAKDAGVSQATLAEATRLLTLAQQLLAAGDEAGAAAKAKEAADVLTAAMAVRPTSQPPQAAGGIGGAWVEIALILAVLIGAAVILSTVRKNKRGR